jgi:hypothetical protein
VAEIAYSRYRVFTHPSDDTAMAKTTPKSRTGSLPQTPAKGGPGRPPRAAGRARRQIVVDTALLDAAMALTGQGQSDTVNAALAQLTENAAILEGLQGLSGAFPAHPDHTPDQARVTGRR